MEYLEFVNLVKSLDICLYDLKADVYYRPDFDLRVCGDPEKLYLMVKWISGGVSGGDCWGGEANQPVQGELPKELEDLDTILTEVKPNITFIQYRNLTNKLVNTTELRSHSDWYGNCEYYSGKYVKLKDLYNYLNEMGWLK